MKKFDDYCKVWNEFEPADHMTMAALLNMKYNMLSMRLHTPLAKNPKTKKVVAVGQKKMQAMYGGEMPLLQSEAEALLSLKAKQVVIELFYSIYTHKKKLLPVNMQHIYTNKDLYQKIVEFKFSDYAEKILVPFYKKKLGTDFTMKTLKNAANLSNQKTVMGDNSKLFVLHTVDDIFLNRKHKLWLKQVMGRRCVIFDHGGHLGEMYTEVFQDKLKEIIIKTH